MHEIELKFQVPAAALPALLKALTPRGQTSPPPRQRLQALYFDTDHRRLAAAGIALRLRKEGRRWVQTLKAAGRDAMHRLEHNVELTLPAGLRPGLDLSRHAGTPAGERLTACLAGGSTQHPPSGGEGTAPLREIFATDIWRRRRTLRTRSGSVEVALDQGWIRAGDRKLPVCELEIELLSGSPRAVLQEAERWVRAHGLWLDVRTKAHRGDLLARQAAIPPARGRMPRLDRQIDLDAACRLMHRSLLDATLMNASVLAAGDGLPEHIHQLRVALRRLRAVWRLLDGSSALPDATVQDGLVGLFRELGAARDADVLAALLPRIRALGGPVPEPRRPDAPPPDVSRLMQTPQTTLLWLALIACSLPAAGGDAPDTAADAATDAAADAGGAIDLRPLAIERLRAWHRQAVKQVKAFDTLGDEARHTLRKRLKRLRYGLDSVADLLPKKALRRYLDALRAAQDALGELNDLAVAHDTFGRLVEHDPKAWFALGWVAARRESALAEAARLLRAWAETPGFWKS